MMKSYYNDLLNCIMCCCAAVTLCLCCSTNSFASGHHDDSEEETSCLCESKPYSIDLKYTGSDCSGNNAQGDKFNCSGDSNGTSPVYISAAKKCDSTRSRDEVGLSTTTLNVGDVFTLTHGDPSKKVHSNVCINIFSDSARTNRIQQVEFHTSCSVPLAVGDTYGSIEVMSGINGNNDECGPPPGCQGDGCDPEKTCEVSEAGDKHIAWFAGGTRFVSATCNDGTTGVSFTRLVNGEGLLAGCIKRKYNSSKRFIVAARFFDVVSPGDVNYPPTGSPKDAKPGAPTDTWEYFLQMEGTLIGEGALAGTTLTLTRRGPAVQIGDGAGIHGAIDRYGLAVWFDAVDGEYTTHGDFNIYIDCEDDDCLGVPGGDAVVDSCGICDGNGPGACGCDLSIYPDACGVCGGDGPGECGCDLTIIKDECGVCAGPGAGPCGCGDIVRDECGICGGDGPGECGCDANIIKDSCEICGGDGPNECGSCDGSIVKDECGVCGGPGEGPCGCNDIVRDECGICGGDGPSECGCDSSNTKDECGICGGEGKDQCGFCPDENSYGVGKDECGICPGDSKYGCGQCNDCLDIPNGPNVEDTTGLCCLYGEQDECGVCGGTGPDECGVCGGSGPNECGSCDGDLTCQCKGTDYNDVAFKIDAHSALLLKWIKKVVRQYKKAGGPGGLCSTDAKTCAERKKQRKKLAREVLKTSKFLHMEIWSDVWATVGGEFTTCPDGVCPVADLRLIKQKIKHDLWAMYIEFKRMARKVLSNQDRPSKAIRKQIRKLKKITKENMALVDEVPDIKSLCE